MLIFFSKGKNIRTFAAQRMWDAIKTPKSDCMEKISLKVFRTMMLKLFEYNAIVCQLACPFRMKWISIEPNFDGKNGQNRLTFQLMNMQSMTHFYLFDFHTSSEKISWKCRLVSDTNIHNWLYVLEDIKWKRWNVTNDIRIRSFYRFVEVYLDCFSAYQPLASLNSLTILPFVSFMYSNNRNPNNMFNYSTIKLLTTVTLFETIYAINRM